MIRFAGKIGLGVFILGVSVFGLSAPALSFQDNASRTLSTLKKIDEFPLYEMHYFGDYGFADFLKKGIDDDEIPVPEMIQANEQTFLCTCFAGSDRKGDRIFGRNFDWHRHPALLLYTDPPQAYASVSMVDIYYLGFSYDRKPTVENGRRLLEAPFYPFDGMNECGLAVGMNAVPYADGMSDPAKKTIGSLHVIRLLLDYAKDVDEALALLDKYNVRFQEVPIHYLVADDSGHSAAIEFIKGEMRVLRNQTPFQVTTNFVITDTSSDRILQSCWRYSKAHNTLEQTEGALSPGDALSLLADVSQAGSSSTIWSALYNLSSGNIRIVMDRKFEQVHEHALKLK